MRLNSTDLALVEVFGMLRDLKRLSELVESGLTENLQLEQFTIEHLSYPDEVIRDAEKWALNDFREKAFGSYLRYGLVLLIYSTIESQLNFTVSIFYKRNKLEPARITKNKNESNLGFCKRKLEQFDINPPIRWIDFGILDGLAREVRNCIAHNAGIPNSELQRKITSSLDIMDINAEKRIFIQSAFIDEMLSSSQSFFENLSYDLGFLIKNKKKPIQIITRGKLE